MTAGPYSVARHPIYVANFLLALPLFLAVNVWPLTIAFTAWFALTHLAIIVREDEILQERYGTEWVRYASEVRRIIPRLVPFKDRRGAFSLEPIVKGMEIPKALGMVALLPLALELLGPYWDALASWIRGACGF